MDESSNQSAPTASPPHHQNNNTTNEDGNANESANTSASLNEETANQTTSEPMPQTSLNGHHEVNAQTSRPQTIVTQIKSEPKEPTVAPKAAEHKPKPKPKPNLDHKALHFQESSLTYKAVQEILGAEGALKWDHKVSQQLQEFMYQITSQMLDHAKDTAEHRGSNFISGEDVDEALETFNKNISTNDAEFEKGMHESAERLNAEPLPKIRSEYGLHAPNERFMIIHPEYRLNELQMDYEPMPRNAPNVFRAAPSNAYSSSIIEQTFNNPNDPSEFD